MRGGDIGLFKYEQWHERVLTFDDNPILVDVITIPITDIITNPKIKANMETYIKEYHNNHHNTITQYINEYNVPQIKDVTLVAESAPYYYKDAQREFIYEFTKHNTLSVLLNLIHRK